MIGPTTVLTVDEKAVDSLGPRPNNARALRLTRPLGGVARAVRGGERGDEAPRDEGPEVRHDHAGEERPEALDGGPWAGAGDRRREIVIGHGAGVPLCRCALRARGGTVAGAAGVSQPPQRCTRQPRVPGRPTGPPPRGAQWAAASQSGPTP